MIDIVPMEQWWHLEHSIKLAVDCLDKDNVQGLREELLHPDAQYYVALIHGGVKGFAGWKRSGINRQVYEFPWCVVHPEYRGQGIGRALIEQRLADMKERSARAVLITTPSPKLYVRFGFRTVEVLRDLWADHLMMLTLD